MKKMEGLYPILAMPFDQSGNIDLEDLENEVEYGIKKGVDGIGLAFGSEIIKLTDSERNTVTKTIVNQAKNRVPIVINTGANSTFAAIQYSKQAEKNGADAIMCLPPPGLPNEAIENYFSEIDSNVAIPIFIQDAGPSPIPEELGNILSAIMDISEQKKTYSLYTKFVLYGTLAIALILAAMAFFLL